MNRALPMRKMMLVELNDFILKAAAEIAADAVRKKRVARVGPKVRGRTIQPGGATPLWNQLRAMIRRWLWEGGDQSALGRVLGLPRQRVHEFITTGRKLPDAERTLQLIAWLAVVRDAAPHSDVRTLRVVKRSGRAARLANSD